MGKAGETEQKPDCQYFRQLHKPSGDPDGTWCGNGARAEEECSGPGCKYAKKLGDAVES